MPTTSAKQPVGARPKSTRSARPSPNPARAVTAAGGPRTLDDLAAMGPDQLLALYRVAKTPRIKDLDGKLTGRMLVVPAIHEKHVAALLRDFAAGGPMPWQGKTFTSGTAGRGEGINRVFGNRATWYRFDTFVGKSRAGDFDAVQLDYDRPSNPFFVRPIKDEVREVGPGLWLGIAYLHTKEKDRLGLYFGLARAGRT